MKILHTADWHAGRSLHGVDRTAEVAEALQEIAELAVRERVDLILVAGDLFDGKNPSAAAEEAVFAFFLETGRADYDQLKKAFDAGDATQVSRSAHTLSGAAGNLGLMPVHEVAKRIELAAIDNRMDQISLDVDALNDHFGQIAREIQA